MPESTTDTNRAMWRLMTAFRQSRSLGVAVELGIAERMIEPRTARELATECGVHERSLLRLLRLLVAMEVASEDASGRFQLTALGEELGGDRLGPLVLYFCSKHDWSSWMHFDHSIKTGERAFDYVHGMRNWEYYATHPDDAAIFDAAMRALTGPVSVAVAEKYDFSPLSKVADVGGGDGTMLMAILKRHQSVRGVLLDRPDVVKRARLRFEEARLIDRCDLVGGSFFEEVPPGADAYLMKSILHDWEDEEAVAILERCRHAAGDRGARLLVVERVMPERVGPDDIDALLSDLNMLVNPGGRERTVSEYSRLFEKARFKLEGTIPLDPQFAIFEGSSI